MIHGLYRGHSWAFWIFFFLTAVGVYHIPEYLSKLESSADRVVFTVTAALRGTAVLCLLLPTSRQWFFSK